MPAPGCPAVASNGAVPMFSGLSYTPADCPAMKKKWFGNDGPITDEKKWSLTAYSLAQCQYAGISGPWNCVYAHGSP